MTGGFPAFDFVMINIAQLNRITESCTRTEQSNYFGMRLFAVLNLE